jgi:hypothetical protein
MLTITCNITYEDGKMLTGTIRAPSARGKYPIKYGGAIDRLPQMPKSATTAAFELLFATAIYDGATGGGVSSAGEYDYGPKYVPNDRFMAVQRNRHLYTNRRGGAFSSK